MPEEKDAEIQCRGLGLFDFISGKNNYTIDLVNQTCTCKHWFYTKGECKHMRIVEKLKDRKGKVTGKIVGDCLVEDQKE